MRIIKYEEALDLIRVPMNDKIKDILKKLESEGRKEKSICYAIWKSQDKIIQYKCDNRFYSIFENEIRKWSWSYNDPRWKSIKR